MRENSQSLPDDDEDYFQSQQPRKGQSRIFLVVLGVVSIGGLGFLFSVFAFRSLRQNQAMIAERQAMEAMMAERDAQARAARMGLLADPNGMRKVDSAEFIQPEELDRLPEGIKVAHEPKVVLATLSGKSERRSKYTWWYKTTVSAIGTEVAITHFGAFKWKEGRWQAGSVTGRPFTVQEFADWYRCPLRVLKPGASYTDLTNWTSEPALEAGKTRWYFIGVDVTGRQVKGEASIELQAAIDPQKPKDPE